MEQVQSLSGLLDAGLRSIGLRAAKEASQLAEILEQAVIKYKEEEKNKEKPKDVSA